MTSTPDSLPDTSTLPKPRASWREGLAVYLQRRVLIVLLLGFSSGLPLALSGSTLLVWMRESGVDLGTIGLFALVGTPYTLKFLWAPLVDALHVPFFTRAFGRRRGWLVFSQLLLIGAILLLALTDPAGSPLLVALGALLVATMSSTQDIVVDAFRVESLPESEQAAGMASYVAAYRIGMLVSTAGALFMVSAFESTGIPRGSAWMWGYVAMAALVLIGTATALSATEPEQSARAEAATRAETAFTRVIHAAIGAGVRDLGGKFHQRRRHGDLRRLPLRAVPKPAAYRHPIRAADGACRGRAHLSVLRRGLCGEGDWLAVIFCDLRRGRGAEPDP